MRQDTADRLFDINRELCGLYVELAEVRKAEREAYDRAYHDSGLDSAAASKAMGRHNALAHHLDSLGISGKISALQEERDYLRFVTEHGYG